MKKAKRASRRDVDELRPTYKRSDFGPMVRGKYTGRVAAATNVVVLEAELAKAFPNDRAVNKALRQVLRARKSAVRPAERPRRARAAG
jgi:hypothetical protein